MDGDALDSIRAGDIVVVWQHVVAVYDEIVADTVVLGDLNLAMLAVESV